MARPVPVPAAARTQENKNLTVMRRFSGRRQLRPELLAGGITREVCRNVSTSTERHTAQLFSSRTLADQWAAFARGPPGGYRHEAVGQHPEAGVPGGACLVRVALYLFDEQADPWTCLPYC